MAFVQELPADLVADVLRRLPPRSLAICRCACRAWRDLVDDRRLLRADLLPRAVGGIFMNYYAYFSTYEYSEFLARPTTGPSISADLEFLPGPSEVMGHCNGLVLCPDYYSGHHYHVHCIVANPATRQWARLPLPPQQMMKQQDGFPENQCLVYDPAVSPHYHVFLINYSLDKDQHKFAMQGYVYSSETEQWEERWFLPEVPLVETTTIAVDDKEPKVYWRGSLYLLCKNDDFVLRISISTASYRLIPTAAQADGYHGTFSLGRSEKGVYCAYTYDWHRLRIFLLNESCGQMVWELQHSVDLRTFARKLHAREGYSSRNSNDGLKGPWILEDINYYKEADKRREVVEDNFEWNSDDDNVLNTDDMVEGWYDGYTSVLGFHTYKEVVFLNAALSRAVAYHWNTSKFQDLGNICPKDHDVGGDVSGIETSFIYTPCWMEGFPKRSSEAPISTIYVQAAEESIE